MGICQKFIKGINYWPINKAMYWWRKFDVHEVKEDFQKIASFDFSVVRLFLTWEDFQPQAQLISKSSLENLKSCADLAAVYGLKIMPSFFCGHMSGINWMPKWMLNKSPRSERFLIYSGGNLQDASIRNFYNEEEVLEAQVFQVREICSALQGHEAVFAYDLGNESSNCAIPRCREEGQAWLQILASTIKHYSTNALLTLGMHAEDLEENRHIWPQDAASYCDFLCMHAYPFYLSWLDNPFDVYILPFLGIITECLGRKPVLFQEFGAPSKAIIPPLSKEYSYKCPLWTEEEVACYYRRAMELLVEENMMGAFAWCFADYDPKLWSKPPLEQNPHERHFGLFRHDGSAKPAAEVFKQEIQQKEKTVWEPSSHPWLNGFDRDSFYNVPQNNLIKLYKQYRQHLLSEKHENS